MNIFAASKKTIGIVGLVVIALAIPLTVFVAQQQQDIRQRAGGGRCEQSGTNVPQGACNVSSTSGASCPSGWCYTTNDPSCKPNYLVFSCPTNINTQPEAPPTTHPDGCARTTDTVQCLSEDQKKEPRNATANAVCYTAAGRPAESICVAQSRCGKCGPSTPVPPAPGATCEHIWCLATCENGNNAEKAWKYPSGSRGTSCGKYFTNACLPICAPTAPAPVAPVAPVAPPPIVGTACQTAGGICANEATFIVRNVYVKATNPPLHESCQAQATRAGTNDTTCFIQASSSSIQVNLDLKLKGIGNGNKENPNPQTTQKQVTVRILSGGDEQIGSDYTATITYDQSTKTYKGTVPIANIRNGAYLMRVKTVKYLGKRILGLNVVSGTTVYSLPQTILIVGDIVDDNIIDISDYNAFNSCFEEKANTSSCQNKTNADLTDDGDVDLEDLPFLFESFSSQRGE